ncbi:hypothetical protein MCHK_3014 [Mesorhizobium huakuii 7653R]|nr:hypothetical protein MCHK_3014 [Mesorhizobium huakuii 7653R]
MNADEALMELYRRLKDRNAPKAGAFTTLSDDERRDYFKLARRRSRANDRAAIAAGSPAPTTSNIRHTLADAALMILAVDAPGADLVREVLADVFRQRPGVPFTVQQRARAGKLRPRLANKQGKRP